MLSTEPEFPPPPGTVLAGKYTVVRTVGRGGMAAVLEAHHERLGRSVAVKLLHPNHRSDEEATSRFEREARAVARLASNNVARVIDVDALADGSPFMVLELLKGLDLGQELARRGPLPVEEAVGYILEACAGVYDAHRAGVVHRDLKPSNLFLAREGEQRCVKVLDFGISKVLAESAPSVTSTHSAFGTPLYMSPEQIRSVKNVDARTDIWSLAVILYEILSGRLPFVQETPTAIFVSISVDTPPSLHELRSEVPQGLSSVVMKALSKSPDDRYPDVAAFAAALLPYAAPGTELAPQLAEGASRALEAAGTGSVRSATGGTRRAAMVVGACFLVGVIAVTAARYLRPAEPPPAPTAAIEPEVRSAEVAPPAAPVVATPPSVEPLEPTATEAPSARKPPPAASTGRRAAPTPAPRPTEQPSATPVEPSPPPKPTATDDPKYL